MTDTTNLSNEQLSLLGKALLSVQRLENSLYQSIRALCKQNSSSDTQAIENLTSEQFLKGTITELKPVIQQLYDVFGETLVLSSAELNEFLYKRNLVSLSFWQVTTTSVKGNEKLANPTLFLQELIDQCDLWLAKLES
ncbi:glucosamine-6-phosphate deaminase [Vibrio sp. Isolate31]|uniref:glucosamine-6-phosphate deaminase n=1 Tax=unclassified Vibrio TaxID=2614977 RepID=UPI001EFE8004|nr:MULTISPECIES: glucosamine-6-phosphate deaminase [unclassified Vibrio]MCG9555112.1 glucosamine-6-phosphate deaminase [Vibrio sp. Isolate32]MCG9602116.1 glucosamine-6-phosphate deaminase [Vibrio sp. Isolate31]